MNYDVKNQEN